MTDTDKLNLLEEHAKEYYNGRLVHFVKNGFIQYELFNSEYEGRAVYIAELFVNKGSRDGAVLYNLIKYAKQLEHTEGVKVAFCRVSKDNPKGKSIKYLLASMGFKFYNSDYDGMYYKLLV